VLATRSQQQSFGLGKARVYHRKGFGGEGLGRVGLRLRLQPWWPSISLKRDSRAISLKN
jgi:hypothetical protein